MSFKVIGPSVILNNVNIATSKTSVGVHVLFSDNIGIQVIWTGTPTGTFGMEVSNTATVGADGTVSGGTWSTYTLTSPPAPSGSSSSGIIPINQLPYAFMRLTYTAVSGAGNLTAVLTAKPV